MSTGGLAFQTGFLDLLLQPQAKRLNVAQEIYLVFYAVLCAVMLNSISGLHAFPWGFLYESPKGGLRLVWRLFVSILCLYVLPALLFGILLKSLATYPDSLQASWHAAVFVVTGLSAFAPYRLFMFLMIGLRATPLRLYSRSAFEEIAERRHIRRSAFGQFLAFLFYLATGSAGALLIRFL